MTCLADNPAVTDPRKSLDVSERRDLLAIRDYRRQFTTMSGAMVGPLKVTDRTMIKLRRHGLIRGHVPNLMLTEAGRIAADRLKGR